MPLWGIRVTNEEKMSDSECLDWLDVDSDRLEDVRGTMNNENMTVREAIMHLSKMDSKDNE